MNPDKYKYEPMITEADRRRIIWHIAREHSRFLNVKKVPENVSKFCGIDFSSWRGKRVKVVNYLDVNKPLEITVW